MRRCRGNGRKITVTPTGGNLMAMVKNGMQAERMIT